MGPQIRLLQNNNTMMAEKIQSTIVNTIAVEEPDGAGTGSGTQPAGHAGRARRDQHDQRPAEEERRGTEAGTIETAKESQRGIVDIETLQQTNKSLIETLDELNKIQSEGRAKRVAAEQELTRIEDD